MFTDAETVERAPTPCTLSAAGTQPSVFVPAQIFRGKHFADLSVLVKLSYASVFQSKVFTPTFNTLSLDRVGDWTVYSSVGIQEIFKWK